MRLFNSLWDDGHRLNDINYAFSIDLFNGEKFTFKFAPGWPSSRIESALFNHLTSADNSLHKSWDIYCGYTDEFDLQAILEDYPRDFLGRIALQTENNRENFSPGLQVAFYNSINGVFRGYDFVKKRAMILCPKSYYFPEWDLFNPFKEFWHIWALQNNGLLVHGAVVAEDDIGVVLLGEGGAGKSTTTISCLQESMQTTGDDFNLLLFKGEEVLTCTLYSCIKIKGGNLLVNKLPMLSSWKRQTYCSADKHVYYPGDNSKVWSQSIVKIKSMLSLQIPEDLRGNSVRISQNNSNLDALKKLSVSSILQSPFQASHYLKQAVKLCQTLPVSTISLSEFPHKNAAAIYSLILDKLESDRAGTA